MALKGFMASRETRTDHGSEADPAAASAPRPVVAAQAAPRTVAPSTSVDATSELQGKLRCKQTLRIDGRIEGEVECEKTVLVGEGAQVYASVEAEEVQVSGRVEGNIIARRKITLERTAVVIGDLTTPGIVIEEGAKLKGRIVIGSDDEVEVAAKPAANADKQADAERKADAQTKAEEQKKQDEKPQAAAGKKPGNGNAKRDPAPGSQPVASA